MRQFKLYEPGAHWCSEADYGAIVGVVERLRPATVLEFGPGWSTLALIEGGAGHVVTCEDDPHWYRVWSERLQPHQNALVIEVSHDAATLTEVFRDDKFELGLVDGPVDISNRPTVIEYCLARCKAVLVPLETSHGTFLLATVERLAKAHGRALELIESGPLAGAYALLT